MSIYTYSAEKNLKLIKERAISFEEVIVAINDGCLLDIVEHPNDKRYANQKIFIVAVRDYVYLVPCVIEENGNVFMKTIIPSRKAKQKYMGGNHEIQTP